MNYLVDKSQSQRSSPEVSKNRRVPSTATSLALPQPPNNPRPVLPPPSTSPPRKDHPVQEASQSSHKESTSPVSTLLGASKASSHSHSKSSSKGKSPNHHSDLSKQKSTHREEKHHPQSESSNREHRSSNPSKDFSGSDKKGHKLERSTGRINTGSCKKRNCSNDEDHHRSHGMRSHLLQNSKGLTSSAEKDRSHQRRQDTAKLSTTDSEHHADRSWKKSYSRADSKCKCQEQRIRSSDIKEQEKVSAKQHCVCQSDSKERTGDRPSKSDPRKEAQLHTDQSNRRSKRSTSSERRRNCAKRRSKDRDSCRTERRNLAQDVLKHACDAANAIEKKSAKESSPHRKLCFMETLNLTRSPIKKPVLSGDGNHASVDVLIEQEPNSQESSEPDMDNMHIIDEVSGSELEAGSQGVVEQPQNSKDPQSENCEEDACIQAEDHNGGKSVVSEQQLEEHLVQTLSDYVQPIRTEDQKSVCLTHSSPDSSSFQVGSDEGHSEMASNSAVDKYESVQPTAGVTDCSFSPKNNSGNVFDSSAIASEPCVTGSSPKQACSSKITVLQNDKEHAPASQGKETSADNSASDAACLQNRELCQEPRPPPTCSIHEKDSDVVSSTISLELLPQEGLSLPDAIYILTQTDEPASDVVSTTNKAGRLSASDAVAKISSTTQEVFLPDTAGEPSVTPEKSSAPGKSRQDTFEPASSKPFLHDEDSMMRVLSNLRMIPDPISPLRSPVQTSRRSYVCAQSKPGHVKSLEKGKADLIYSFFYLSAKVV